jgi:hypothetical protein
MLIVIGVVLLLSAGIIPLPIIHGYLQRGAFMCFLLAALWWLLYSWIANLLDQLPYLIAGATVITVAVLLFWPNSKKRK